MLKLNISKVPFQLESANSSSQGFNSRDRLAVSNFATNYRLTKASCLWATIKVIFKSVFLVIILLCSLS